MPASSVAVAVLGLFIPLMLAVMADRVIKGATGYKTLLIWPYAVAQAIAGMLWLFAGHEFAGQFIAGWLTEYSLSIDNLFVFVLIMGQFAVPRRYQQEVLMVGIIIALILRGLFILAGAAIIEQFSWVFYIFGAFLIYTAVKLATESHDEEDDWEPNGIIKWFQLISIRIVHNLFVRFL